MSAAAAGSVASVASLARPAAHSRRELVRTLSRAEMAPATGTSSAGGKKLRLLALHGFSQDAETFRTRIGSMRKAMKSRADFVFVDAPHVIGDVAGDVVSQAGGRESGRTWWTWSDADRPSKSSNYTGWEASQDIIASALREHGPVDGLVGFSQGATAAALHLATVSDRPGLADIPLPKFAVLIGGFLPRDEKYAAVLRNSGALDLPSLHIYGSEDKMVSMERSIALMNCFAADTVEQYEHSGGHMVPTCTGDFKSALAAYLDGWKRQAAIEHATTN